MKKRMLRIVSISLVLAMMFAVSAFAVSWTYNGIKITQPHIYSYSSTYEGIRVTVTRSGASTVYASASVYDKNGTRKKYLSGQSSNSTEATFTFLYAWSSISSGDYAICYSSALVDGSALTGPSTTKAYGSLA